MLAGASSWHGGEFILIIISALGVGPGAGSVMFFSTLPTTAAAGSAYMQAFVIDGGSGVGVSATDAVRMTTM